MNRLARLRFVVPAVVIATLPAAGAWAQKADVGAAKEDMAWLSLVVAAGLCVVVAVGCFMSPKRSHQD
jgi:hypothetical protein